MRSTAAFGNIEMPAALGALICAVLLASATHAQAQVRPIRGTVTDEQGRPVAGAEVRVTSVSESLVGFVVRDRPRPVGGRTWQTTSGENGDYLVGVSASGVYVVSASKDGVGEDETQIVVEFSGVSNANLRLHKAPTVHGAHECGANATLPNHDGGTGASDTSPPSLARLLRWLEAVEVHTPGCADSRVLEIGTWPPSDFESLLGDLVNLSAFVRWARERPGENSADGRATIEPLSGDKRRSSQARFERDSGRVASIILHNRRYSLGEIEQIFRGNDTLKRGAVLHADIAAFVPGTFIHYPGVDDGRAKGRRRGTVHWQIGRQLLDTLEPGPGTDAGALLWYRAVAAHLFREGRLAEVAGHLDRARQIFSDDPGILLDSAYLHLELASPAIQAAILEVKAEGTIVAVDSRRNELERAERFLRSALAHAPEDAEARCRLGHTLGELGRHEEAVAQLRRALEANPSARQRYLAELFLGRQEHQLGRTAEAGRRYENAAAIFPNAQSPYLALSQLARQSGDRIAALRAVRRLDALAENGGDDPWLSYYQPHREDAVSLMKAMREQLTGTSEAQREK